MSSETWKKGTLIIKAYRELIILNPKILNIRKGRNGEAPVVALMPMLAETEARRGASEVLQKAQLVLQGPVLVVFLSLMAALFRDCFCRLAIDHDNGKCKLLEHIPWTGLRRQRSVGMQWYGNHSLSYETVVKGMKMLTTISVEAECAT